MINFNKLKAFTLAELLLCLAIISVIVTLTFPMVSKVRPNKHKALYKKSYYLTERIVHDLINDPDFYPETSGYIGFDDVSEVKFNGEAISGESKFCKLFAKNLNFVGENSTPNCTESASIDNPSFTTTDGVAWILPYSKFDEKGIVATVMPAPGSGTPTPSAYSEYHLPYEFIYIDVNGATPPNCEWSDTCKDPDRFYIYIYVDGTVKPDEHVEATDNNMVDKDYKKK